jgi:hypothetical protein
VGSGDLDARPQSVVSVDDHAAPPTHDSTDAAPDAGAYVRQLEAELSHYILDNQELRMQLQQA